MTKENRELLIRDLSARLPYNVALNCKDEDCNFTCYLIPAIFTDIQSNNPHYEYKPYLFPLSSMTEEQRMELNSLLPVGVSLQINSNNFTYFEINTDLVCCFHIEFWDKFFDWLYKHHIDFRGLIEKSLALDATNLNIY